MFKFIKSEAEKAQELLEKWKNESKAFAIKEFQEGIAKGEQALVDVGLALDEDALAALTSFKSKLEAEDEALKAQS